MHFVSRFLFSHVVRRWDGGWSSIIQYGWFFPVVLNNYYYLNKHIAHCTLLLKQSLKRPGARSSFCLKGTVTRRAIQESFNFHWNNCTIFFSFEVCTVIPNIHVCKFILYHDMTYLMYKSSFHSHQGIWIGVAIFRLYWSSYLIRWRRYSKIFKF